MEGIKQMIDKTKSVEKARKKCVKGYKRLIGILSSAVKA